LKRERVFWLLFRPFAEGILQHPKMNFALPALIWNSAMDLLQFLVRFPDYKVTMNLVNTRRKEMVIQYSETLSTDNSFMKRLKSEQIILRRQS
jgi:hypothetical protein